MRPRGRGGGKKGTDLELQHGLVARLYDSESTFPDERVLPPVLSLPSLERRAGRDLVHCGRVDERGFSSCETNAARGLGGRKAAPLTFLQMNRMRSMRSPLSMRDMLKDFCL